TEIRAAALAARAYTQEDASLLRAALNDGDDHIRGTALVGLAAGGWIESGQGAKALSDTLQRVSVAGQVSLAAAIRHRPSPLFEAAVGQLGPTGDLRGR